MLKYTLNLKISLPRHQITANALLIDNASSQISFCVARITKQCTEIAVLMISPKL